MHRKKRRKKKDQLERKTEVRIELKMRIGSVRRTCLWGILCEETYYVTYSQTEIKSENFVLMCDADAPDKPRKHIVMR
jgi:hypothetical protein